MVTDKRKSSGEAKKYTERHAVEKAKQPVERVKQPVEKASCDYCKKKFIALPFKCKFCGQEFCDYHRLPEDHHCLGLAMRKEQLQKRISSGHGISYEPQVRREIKVKFDDSYGNHTVVAESQIDLKKLTDPLVKSPLAIIGFIVAAVTLMAITFLLLS